MTKREIILREAAKLFAERSPDAVGIRDIADAAGVNSAMISYYFGSKGGLIREVFSLFAERFMRITSQNMRQSANHYELCRNSVRQLLDDARQHRSIYVFGLKEFYRESELLNDLHEDMQQRCGVEFSAYLKKIGVDGPEVDDPRDDATFQAVMSMIFSDYLLGNGAFIDDDEKYENYVQTITSLLSYGMPSLWPTP